VHQLFCYYLLCKIFEFLTYFDRGMFHTKVRNCNAVVIACSVRELFSRWKQLNCGVLLHVFVKDLSLSSFLSDMPTKKHLDSSHPSTTVVVVTQTGSMLGNVVHFADSSRDSAVLAGVSCSDLKLSLCPVLWTIRITVMCFLGGHSFS